MTKKIKVPALSGFVSSTVKVQVIDHTRRAGLETIAEFANPDIHRDAGHPYELPTGTITVKHPTAENSYGDKVRIFEMLLDHFTLKDPIDDVSIYTGRIKYLRAYEELPDFSGETYPSSPPTIDEVTGLDVIITITPVLSQESADRAVKHLGS